MRPIVVRLALVLLAIGAVHAAGPVIVSASPNPIDAGGPYFPLTINGSGFVNGSVARWGKTTLSTVYVSPGQLIAEITPDLRLISDNYALTVSNPNLAASNAYQVSVLPVMGGVTPGAARAGGPVVPIQVKGIGFQSRFLLQLSAPGGPVSIPATVVDSFTLTAEIPPSALVTPRSATIHVVDPQTGNASASAPFEIRAAPAIAGLSPSPVDAGGGYFLLNVTGSGFASGDSVNWPGGVALGTKWVSDTLLQAAITPDLRVLSGTFNLTVSDPSTGATSSPYGFVVSPVLFGIAPASAAAGSADVKITASGAGFTRASAITASVAGKESALSTTYVDSGTLTALIPSGATASSGTIAVQVVDSAGVGRSLSQNFTVSQTVPVLATLAPAAVSAGGTAFSLAVNGRGFVSGAVVKWNAAPLSTTFQSSSLLTASVSASLIQAQGTVAVTAVNPGGDPSAALTFTINPPPPVLSSISPSSAIAGGGSFTLTVNGANCGSGCTVQWNGSLLNTTAVSATQVTAIVPANLLTAPGNASIRLVNVNGAASTPATFVVNPGPATITSLNPGSATAGDSFVLTVNGTNFVPGAAIQWNGTPLATTFVSPSQLTATVSSNLLNGMVSASIAVMNPGGAVSNSLNFTVQAPGPSITGLTPAAVTAGGGPFTLTVSGANFAANCVVRWNGSPLYTTFGSAAQVSANVPPELIASGGSAAITLANPSGSLSNAVTLPIQTPRPAVEAVNPLSAAAGSTGVTVTVTGSGFLSASIVMWNETALTTRYGGGTELRADVPGELLAAPGTASITVATPGLTASNAATFTVGAAFPAVASGGIVNAASGVAGIAPGSLISIYGTNLATAEASAQLLPLEKSLNGTSVAINGVAAPLVFVSAGQINAQIPFEIAPGTASLVVQSPAGKSAPAAFDVTAIAPGILPVVLNAADESLNSAQAAVQPGQYVTVWVTGQGAVLPQIATGDAAPSDPFAVPIAPVLAQIGGKDAQVVFAGMAPGLAGLMQVNLIVPDVPAGQRELAVTVGGVKSNAVLIWLGAT